MLDSSSPRLPTRPPIAWFRPSMRKAFFGIWAQAIGFVCLGSLILSLLRILDEGHSVHWYWAGPLGIIAIVAGPLWLAVRLMRVLREETVLTVEPHGLSWREGELSTPIPWEHLEDILVTEEHLVLRGTFITLEIPKRYEDISAEELAKLLMDLRRKALMGLKLSVPEFAWAQSLRL